MKLLFNQKTFFFLVGVLAFSLTFTSCSNDDDEPDREKFLGVFSAVETCGGGTDAYDLIILESGTDGGAVVVNNLYNFGESLSATVSGDNITVASQLAGGLTYSGSGSISGDILTLNFTVANSTGEDVCNAVCTRK